MEEEKWHEHRRWNNIKQTEEEKEKQTGRIGQVRDEDKCNSVVGGKMCFQFKQTDILQDLR